MIGHKSFFFFCRHVPNKVNAHFSTYLTSKAVLNRPFAQLLSGLETGHPAAAGPSSACDFCVSDEQKAVFLVSVLNFSECDSSGLDHLNSMWSNARVREYFRRKTGHS